jgi:ankyrin repeat protein
LIETLVAKQDVTAIPTSSQEIADDLISNVASSVGMKTIPPLPHAESVSIEPEEPVPGSATLPDNAKVTPIDDQKLVHGQHVQLDPPPKSIRRFDTDEPKKVTEDGIALVLAAERGDLEMVKLLLEFEVNPNAIGGSSHHTPLQAAAFCGHIPVLKLLIENGARVSQLGPSWGSPLHAAVKTGRLDVVKILLEANADPDGDAVLVAAADRGDIRCVKALLNAGANVDIRGGGPLQAAAFNGRLEVVKILLEAGANVEATGPPWGSALRAAVQSSKMEVVRVLMENKRGMK